MRTRNVLILTMLLVGCGPRYVIYEIWTEPEEAIHEQNGVSVRTYPVDEFRNKVALELRNQRDTTIALFLSRSVLMSEDSVVQKWPEVGITRSLSAGTAGGLGLNILVSFWKTEARSTGVTVAPQDTIIVPPGARWIDTIITISPERHRLREDKLEENLSAFELEFKGKNLAGVSLDFRDEVINLWVRGAAVGKTKKEHEGRASEQRDMVLLASLFLSIVLFGWAVSQ